MSTAPKKNKKQVRVYLDPEEAAMLAAATKTHPKLTESDIMSWLLSAALKAISQNGYHFVMPLKFKPEDDSEQSLMEFATPTRRKK